MLALFFVAGEPGANVVVPTPSFAPFMEVPTALGVETRRYALRFENGFALDVDEIMRLTDARTKLILVNTPHNPSGALVDEDAIRALDAFAQRRGIPLVVDEVYHPIYHGAPARSAGEYSRATVLGDFSKSFSLPGLRIGWLLERDAEAAPRARERARLLHDFDEHARRAAGRGRDAQSRDDLEPRAHASARRISRCSTSGARRTRSRSSGCGRAAR